MIKNTPFGVFLFVVDVIGFPRTGGIPPGCGAFVSAQTALRLFSLTHCRTGNLTIAWFSSGYHMPQSKTPRLGCFYLWWM